MFNKKFSHPDFLNIDQWFSQDEIQVRNSVREFINKEVMPIIADCHWSGRFPQELIQPLAELGVFGPTIEGYGCAGVNPTSYGLMMQEIERADSGLRSFVSVQGALCMHPIYKYASEKLKQKFLPQMAQGKLIGCFGLTEADHGSDPASMSTTVQKKTDHFLINGNKMWITNGEIADLAIVWAKADNGKVQGFIVEKDFPGFQTQPIEKKYSLRSSVTSELIFDNCKVPLTHKLNIEGLKGPFSCLNQARFGIAWGSVGAAMACYHEALSYAETRIQFGQPIASFQLVQAKLVHLFTEITKAQLLNFHLGRLADQEDVKPQQISMAKMNNVSMALEAARTARDILGASGITYEYQCGRHMMNLESVNTYEGTEDIHRLILGQHITGISAFK